MKKVKTISIIILVIILSIVGMGFYKSWFSSKSMDISNIPTVIAKKGEFTIAISEVGKLDAKKSMNVTSNTQGKIVKMVPEGTQVSKGDPIVWLDTSDLEKQIKDGENNLKNAEQDMQKGEETQRLSKYQNDMSTQASKLALENSKIDYSDATIKLAKTQRLYDAQVVPETSLEDAKLRVLSAKTNVEKAELSLAQVEETQKSNLVSGQIQIAQSKAAYAENKRKLDEFKNQMNDTILKAPGDGILVYEMMWRSGDRTKIQEGDQVWQRMSIAQLPDLSQMITEILVDEIDISRVKQGQEIRVKVDAIPGMELKGKISQIGTLAVDKGAGDAPWWMRREASGVKAFEVSGDIESNSFPLRPGMTTKTDVIIEKFPSVVYIPRESVFDKNGKKMVYVVQSKSAKERVVKTGKGDGNYVIIESGLTGGEVLCLRDPTQEIKEANPDEKKEKKKESAPPAVPSIPSPK